MSDVIRQSAIGVPQIGTSLEKSSMGRFLRSLGFGSLVGVLGRYQSKLLLNRPGSRILMEKNLVHMVSGRSRNVQRPSVRAMTQMTHTGVHRD